MSEGATDMAVDAEVIESHDTPTPAPTSAVARREWTPSALAEMSDGDFERRLEMAQKERTRIERIQKAVMRPGIDYGVIPGTDKPTIYKAGAEILNKMAQLCPSFSPTARYGDGESSPQIHYRVTCHLHDGSKEGPIVCEGVGSANSWEKKHRYRNAGPPCPTCGAELRKSKRDAEWYCWAKKGGCGATFPLDEHKGGVGENPDPFDLDNTLLKMAKKRAYNDATLTAHAASGIFTTDVQPPQDDDAQPPAQARGDLTISEPQRRRMYKLGSLAAERLGVPAEQVDEYAKAMIVDLGFQSSTDLTREPYETICNKLEALTFTDLVPPAEAAPGVDEPPPQEGPFD